MKINGQNLVKKIGETTVINHVNFQLVSGAVYGFKGINGSGKTMLMRLIAGLIYPTAGKVFVDNRELKGENSFPQSMGLLIENPSFLGNYSGYENLKMLASISKNAADDDIKSALCRVGLDPTDKRKYRKYSLGMKQRLGIACAIMEKPQLIILDEPLNALDECGIEMVLKVIEEEKARGALIIMACHDYEILSNVADELFFLTAGAITRHMIKDAQGEFSEVD